MVLNERMFLLTKSSRLIAMMQPKQSWVAKWQRIVRFVPGIYAISVTGEVSENMKNFLDDRGIPCRATK